MGRELGVEKIYLKAGRMSLFFVSNPDSPYYEGEAFGAILAYAGQNPMTCRLREDGTKRSLLISDVPDVERAISILTAII